MTLLQSENILRLIILLRWNLVWISLGERLSPKWSCSEMISNRVFKPTSLSQVTSDRQNFLNRRNFLSNVSKMRTYNKWFLVVRKPLYVQKFKSWSRYLDNFFKAGSVTRQCFLQWHRLIPAGHAKIIHLHIIHEKGQGTEKTGSQALSSTIWGDLGENYLQKHSSTSYWL